MNFIKLVIDDVSQLLIPDKSTIDDNPSKNCGIVVTSDISQSSMPSISVSDEQNLNISVMPLAFAVGNHVLVSKYSKDVQL